MRWRRKHVWTDPLQPTTEYVNVLGSKLKFLMRATRGVDGNNLIARNLTDSVSGRRIPRGAGTPVYAADGSFFGAKPVILMNGSASYFLLQLANPITLAGDTPELFVVVRLASYSANFRLILTLANAAATAQSLSTNVGTVAFLGNSSVSQSFSDTASPHFITGRTESGTTILSIDGIDVNSTGGGVPQPQCDRVYIGFSPNAPDGSIALCGVVQSAMSAAERADIYRIARAEFDF